LSDRAEAALRRALRGRRYDDRYPDADVAFLNRLVADAPHTKDEMAAD
jgi:hypothetical protein